MTSLSRRRDLFDRLRYTFITSDYQEIDSLIGAIRKKENFEELCEEFFHGCTIDSAGYLVPGGFFGGDGSASLQYVLYELLGVAPETFLLKHRVTRVKFIRGALNGCFRLPGGLFLLPRLEVLTIRGIGISRMPEALLAARGIRVLDLSYNRFCKFPDIVLKLPHISVLNLAYNRLDRLPENLGRLKNLRILNLRGNSLAGLPSDWHRLQYLRILDVSMNRISSVPDSLRTLVSLNELRLSYNDLPAADEALWERRAKEDQDQGTLGIGG